MYSNSSLIQTLILRSFKAGTKSMFLCNRICLKRNVSYLLNDICELSKLSRLRLTELSSNFSTKMSNELAVKSACIFCNIVNKLEDTEILFEDDQVCVFRDIKPASTFHVLTVPKRHIEDCKSLTSADKELVQHMLNTAQDLIQKKNLSLEDARLGYHWPPFRSVKHLHLHAIAPESEMGFISRMVFKRDSYWFVSPEYVATRL